MATESPEVHDEAEAHSDLTKTGPLSLRDTLHMLQALARDVRQLHEQGHWHGRITFANIQIQPGDKPQLAISASPVNLSSPDRHLETCPPELAGEASLVLPLTLKDAQFELKRRALDVDPRRIDVYQLAGVLCRLALGITVRQYADSPRAKAQAVPLLRAILDPALGFDSPTRTKTCHALLEALEDALAGLPEAPPASELNTPAIGSPASAETVAMAADTRRVGQRERAFPQQYLAHFRLISLIGRGGMGEVYRAHDEQLDRHVAVKVLRHDLHTNDTFLRRFRNEADIIARLPHPNLVSLYFVGEDQGRRFYAMQLVEGESLAQRLRNTAPLSLDEVIAIMTQCLSALAAAHDEGLIHRDIKPANILLEQATRRAYVVDFGLARQLHDESGLTSAGLAMGTAEYFSPEQARGDKHIDQRADLYSLGVVFYQMLARQLPFAADSAVGWIFQHAHEPPRPLTELAPHVPPALVTIVNRLLAKRPDDRPADCREVLQALEPWQPADLRTRQLTNELSSVLATPPAAAALDSYERRELRLAHLKQTGERVLACLREQAEMLRGSDEPARTSLLAQLQPLHEQVGQLDREVERVQAALVQLRRDKGQPPLQHPTGHPPKKEQPSQRLLIVWLGTLAACLLLLSVTLYGVYAWFQPAGDAVDHHESATQASAQRQASEQPHEQAPAPPPLTQDAKAATLVRSLGGAITIIHDGVKQEWESEFPLPTSFQLTGIDLQNCTTLTAEHLAEIAKLTSLDTLKLLHTHLSDDAFAQLSQLTTLQQLGCGDTKVTGAPLQDFALNANMHYLIFGGPFDPHNVVYLDRFPNIRMLCLCWTPMTDAGIQDLPSLPHLDHLILDHTHITGETLDSLERFPKLLRLRLGTSSLTDAGLQKLPTTLPLLELEVQETQITDAVIPHLLQFQNLLKLEVSNTKLTPAGVEQLIRELPRCHVVNSFGK